MYNRHPFSKLSKAYLHLLAFDGLSQKIETSLDVDT